MSRASMPAVHSATAPAQTNSRARIVCLQSGLCRAAPPGTPPPRRITDPISDWRYARVRGMTGSARRDDGFFRWRCRGDALDHDRLAARRRHEVELLGGDLLDAPRGAQRFNLETEVAVDVFFRGAL